MVHPQASNTSAAARGADPTATAPGPGNYLDLPGFMVPGILRAFEAEDLEALAAGGTSPAVLESSTLHRLLDLSIELSVLIRGRRETSIKYDDLGPAEVVIRVDAADWDQAAKALHSWARVHVRPDDGDELRADSGYVTMLIRRVGVVRCWSARLRVGGAS